MLIFDSIIVLFYLFERVSMSEISSQINEIQINNKKERVNEIVKFIKQ